MLKIIAAMVATCAVLAGLALAVDEESALGQPTDTPTPAPTDTATPAPSATATAAPTSTAAADTASPTATRALTPAAVPGTGGEPDSATSLLLILALGAGVVAGAAGLAGIAVMRRS